MANYPQTGSILDSKTRTSLSTQILIMVENEPVGTIQSFDSDQSRGIKRIHEVGTHGTLEGVPDSQTQYSLSVKRIVFDGLSITEAFSRGFRNINAQRIPFDIVVIDQFSGQDNDAVITTYEDCWFESVNKALNAENFVITEGVKIFVGNVRTLRGGEAVALSQGIGGGRQVSTQIDDVELLADSGARRGTLDFPGLINAAFN